MVPDLPSLVLEVVFPGNLGIELTVGAMKVNGIGTIGVIDEPYHSLFPFSIMKVGPGTMPS